MERDGSAGSGGTWLWPIGAVASREATSPRHFDITFDDLHDGIARLLRCEHR